MKIFGANLIVFRIYNLVIFALIYVSTYALLKVFVKRKFNSFVYLAIIIILTRDMVIAGANYNSLAIAFILLGFTFFFKVNKKEKLTNYTKSWKYVFDNILIGTSMFAVFLTKQNFGVYYILSIIFCQLAKSIREKSKKDFLKNSFIQLLSALILLIIFLIYLYMSGEFYAFLDNTVLNISEFASNNYVISIPDIHLIIILYSIVIASIITTIIICCLNKKNKKIQPEKLNDLLDLMIVSIPLLLISYPLANVYHVKIAVIVGYIFTAYLFEILIYESFKEAKIFRLVYIIAFIILLGIMLGYSAKDMVDYVSKLTNYKNRIEVSDVFDNVIIKDENIDKINEMTKYIQQKKEEETTVLVLSREAAWYMVPLKLNNGKYDLLFLGNLGKDGEDGVIEELKEIHENNVNGQSTTQILIVSDEEEMFWQESEKVREYITQNMEKIDTIEIYDIYV